MPHYNLYSSLGLDRSQSAESIEYEIEQRISAGLINNPGGLDELRVAQRVLGDPDRRAIYDRRLDDSYAPEITVDALRQLATTEIAPRQQPVTAFGAATDSSNARRGYDSYPTQEFARARPAVGVPTAAESRQVTDVSTAASVDKRRNPLPWIIGAVALLLIAGLLTWWLTQRETTEEWTGQNAELAEAFPKLISDADGGAGFMGMTCRSHTTEGDESAKIRCAGPDNGVSVFLFDSVEERDASIPAGKKERYGNDSCTIETVELEGQNPAAYFIAPQGDLGTYSLLVNGEDAKDLRLKLPIC
ncbi:hypothetical protein CGLAU_10705 [Corynebacterium glaucum]|uniref:Uncharacterized protein n=1 Tax=Corynebacterium glaucum TaxID=187491 RepID=A0A1Q2HYY9_9CORY|nr:hypothetical protein [Corynebacterium glaucum]AQQ16075.1 hypothetical protein CGLAU_10705 [Corynebacterium glaucum]